MKYPLGIQSFENIREGGYLYLDKTAMVYNVKAGKYYFFSRPRCFGKSLLIFTLDAYFKGKRDLFSNLAISQKEKEWRQHLVLRLDMNVENYKSLGVLNDVLGYTLYIWERLYGRMDMVI